MEQILVNLATSNNSGYSKIKRRLLRNKLQEEFDFNRINNFGFAMKQALYSIQTNLRSNFIKAYEDFRKTEDKYTENYQIISGTTLMLYIYRTVYLFKTKTGIWFPAKEYLGTKEINNERRYIISASTMNKIKHCKKQEQKQKTLCCFWKV